MSRRYAISPLRATLLCLSCAIGLTACSTSCPRPELPPAGLLEPCQPAPVNRKVLPALASGDARTAAIEYVAYAQDVQAATDLCNSRLAALRAWRPRMLDHDATR